MIEIHIDVDIDDAMDMLEGMNRRARDFRAVLKWARRELEKSNSENFTTGGLPVGGWSPRTRDYAWPIMRKSGKLFESLTSFSGSGNVISLKQAWFGTTVEYAKFHQYGTRKMAKRKVVFEPRGFAHDLGDKAAKHIIGLRAELLP